MNGRAYHRRRRHNERTSWPDTTMARAFLIALAHWAIVHHGDSNTTVTLPTGRVTSEQLAQVLYALEKARRAEWQDA
jgi:hypothetical protein